MNILSTFVSDMTKKSWNSVSNESKCWMFFPCDSNLWHLFVSSISWIRFFLDSMHHQNQVQVQCPATQKILECKNNRFTPKWLIALLNKSNVIWYKQQAIDTYLTTTLILSSGVEGALSDDRNAIFSSDSASLLRLHVEKKYPKIEKMF